MDVRDAPEMDARDAPGTDARDAPEMDARDAPGTDARDAPGMDARDAPGTDARDAPGTDARDAPGTDAGPRFARGTNPVLAGDHPDPHVVRTVDGAGRVIYYLYPTAGSGDFSVFESRDLVRWTRRADGLFRREAVRPGGSVALNGGHYCHLWAPDVVEVRPGAWLLSFSAVRYATAQSSCPGYREDGGVYVASSSSPTGPFAVAERPWEPFRAGGHLTDCPASTPIPHSLDRASQDCQGGFCHHIIRLDSSVFRDPRDGRWWMGYSWYTNTPPRVDWERGHYGQHVNLVELEGRDPWTVRCTAAVPQVGVGDPHDGALLSRLASSCPRCGEMLSFTRERQGRDFARDGYVWGVNEGVSLFRRNRWVYALMSGSTWDSAYYSVYWVAADRPEGLASDAAGRLAGRLLIPSRGQSFGHGTPVLGPDGVRWYYVHHRLQAEPCRASGQCGRDVWVTPLEFDDRGDGRGDAWIRPRFPAEDPAVAVAL
ncbi:MAG: family 43 glycosylhydrolase [Polyangiales bacterium]